MAQQKNLKKTLEAIRDELRSSSVVLQSLPEDHEFSMEEQDLLEEIRLFAVLVKSEVESIFEEITYGKE